MPNFKKHDGQGQELNPGDVCVRLVKDNRNFNKSSLEFVVYRGESWGGSKSKGQFGRFSTPHGTRSLKHTSVLFVFDPMGKRRAKSEQVTQVMKQFYERNK